jgi:universal stress protein E
MRNEIQSILAAVDRNGGQAKRVAAKAVSLAHMTGAHLELFLCDAEAAFNRQHQYEAAAAARAKELCLVESRRYLETLRRRLSASEVEISLSVACESPLYESIVHAVERSRPDLVVRGAAPGEPLDPNTWELVAECPAPLILTRGRPWKVRPVIAAAIDVSPGESQELTRAILRAAAGFAKMAGGTIEIVHAGGIESGPPPGFDARRQALAQRASDAGLEGTECHLIAGEPAEALQQFCARRDFDLIVLGALTHRKTLGALVGTLTGRLIESLESDFLLVKPARTPTNAP